MPACAAGDMRIVALKPDCADRTTAAVTIPVCGSAGVDLGVVGRALGLEPSTVRLNGHFVSRGADLVSKLPWNSLLSFFAARGLPAGGSQLDSIVVQGKLIANTGWHSSSYIDHMDHLSFKRKGTIKDERPFKKNRLVEGYSKEQNIGTKQLADDKCLCVKRQLKLVDEYPSKKGKIGESSSDCHSSSNFENVSPPCFKRESTVDDENIPKKNQLFEFGVTDQSFGTEQEADDTDFLCIKRRLKLDDDRPKKKAKTGDCNSGLGEASKIPMVPAEKTGFSNCSFSNAFGKPFRKEEMALSVSCKRIK